MAVLTASKLRFSVGFEFTMCVASDVGLMSPLASPFRISVSLSMQLCMKQVRLVFILVRKTP